MGHIMAQVAVLQMNMETPQVMHIKLSRRLRFPVPVTIRMLDMKTL